jgi:hypothetical protein
MQSDTQKLSTPSMSTPTSLDIGPSKLLDLIISKQNQYYTLWGVYTAVQFAAGSYGYGHNLSLGVGLAILFGVWAFNIGHLGFVLQCVVQLNRLTDALNAALDDDASYKDKLRHALKDMQEGTLFWRPFREKTGLRSYGMNIFVHFFIDTCASIALLMRVKF